MANTYLAVTFAEKDKAKALGARWDAAQRQWYVPSGLELTPFAAWLPSGDAVQTTITSPHSLELVEPPARVLEAPPLGVTLSQLLTGVEKTVAQAYGQGVWTRVEVLNVTVSNRHIYLELSERDETGTLLAQARATIWARTAERIVPEFQRVTGAQLAPGIKLLVLAKPVFKPQFGFSLDISGVDASYTLGSLEAHRRKIREQLQAEGLYDRNKRVAPPWDFEKVLVVAPQGAAGLGDFAAEANRLQAQSVCDFIYVHSRFQGQGAAAEIVLALQKGLEKCQGAKLDAVIIIRGGGAVNDLAWLNDYPLARFICECDVPVLTGIGHERDSTVLDEVAHRSFDTPSKVIAGIETQIAQRVRDARSAHQEVLALAARAVERVKSGAQSLDSEMSSAAFSTLTRARADNESAMSQVRFDSHAKVLELHHTSQRCINSLQEQAKQHIRLARHQVPAAMSSVKELSTAMIRATRADIETQLPTLLGQTSAHVRLSGQSVSSTMQSLLERTRQTVRTAQSDAASLVREVTGQGPKKTLARGFAVVKTKEGKTVTSAKAAQMARRMVVTFNDGDVHTSVNGNSNNEIEGAGNVPRSNDF